MNNINLSFAAVKLISLVVFVVVFVSGCVQPDIVESTVPGNQNPIINSLSANPNPVRVGNITIINCVATDPQNSTLTYSWQTTLGDISGSGPQVQYFATYCCAGSIKVTVTVKNSLGGSTVQSFFINVIQ